MSQNLLDGSSQSMIRKRLARAALAAVLSATTALGTSLVAADASVALAPEPSPSTASQVALSPSQVALAPALTPTPQPTTAVPGGIVKLSPEALRQLQVEMGTLGAHLGQGLKRIAEGKPVAQSVPETVTEPVASSSAGLSQSGGRSVAAKISIPMAGSWTPPGIQGLDVSGYQSSVDWQQQWDMGARFAYVKASEGLTYTSPTYPSQYNGAAGVGMVRGAYHFALPNISSAADQANYFVSNGGGWSADGSTLPPLLDIEYNPYPSLGNTCYNMSSSQMVSWIRDFSSTVLARTGRLPAIYSTTDWWSTCTGNDGGFGANPLHIASYSTGVGYLPNGWSTYSFWQYSSTGPFSGDSNVWNGSYSDLRAFALRGPTVTLQSQFDNFAAANGLGSATSTIICGLSQDGCLQGYDNVTVYRTPTAGFQFVRAAIRDAFAFSGSEDGPMGYPVSGETCALKDSGCYQNFQTGAILWTQATGAELSPAGPIRDAWQRSGFETGPLGYPISGQSCGLAGGGCYQNFQNGAILWSPASGAQLSLNGPIRTAWQQAGFETGPLGYPAGPTICGLKDGGCFQKFQTGSLSWTTQTGTITVWGEMSAAWQASGREAGTLGYPVAAEVCGLTDGGCYQNFQNGATIWSPDSHAQLSPNGPIRTAWQQTGFENGRMGYPISGQVCGLVNGGCYQSFQHGTLIWSAASGAQISTAGAIRSKWQQSGFESGPLGYPTSAETCGLIDGGCYQNFQNGTITWTPDLGAVQLITPIFTAWAAANREAGRLGYPTSAQVCGLTAGGCYQTFQNGAIIWSPATGAQISTAGAIRATWLQSGFESGPLGYPTGGETCGLANGGCYQNFQNGAISWTPALGAFQVTAPIFTVWAAAKRETGQLGFPASAQVCGLAGGGCYQNFQNGAIIWSPATGAQISPTGPIRAAWGAAGFENGGIGYPTSGVVCGLKDNGCYQNFQNGAFLWSAATGAQPSVGQIRIRYGSLGFENSFLGYPTTPDICTLANGGCYQNYQHGSITWYPATGSSVSNLPR